MSIVQGDHGYSIPFIVKKDIVEDLTGAFVEVAIERGGETINKQAVIDDAATGKCHFVLSSSDSRFEGVYTYQWTAYFPDGRIYSDLAKNTKAAGKISTFVPGTGEETLVIPFATKKDLASTVKTINGVTPDETGNVVIEGTGGSGILTFATLAELQTAYPNGTNQPVWVTSENSWYYWDGVIEEPPADTTAPNDITNLATSNITATTLTLSWTASTSTDVVGYEIYKNGVLLTTITGTTYNASGLTASTQYTFLIKAKDASNNVSTGVSITTTTSAVADTTAPANVTNLTTSNLSDVSVTLNWTASASGDVTGYDIYKDGVLLTSTANISYTVTGLTQSTQYTFSVRAKDGAGNVATGTNVTITTNATVVADTTPPVLTITPSGTFTDPQTVTMTTDETATIYYTLDDTDPKTSGTKLEYTAPLTLTETDTVKAYAKDTAGNESAVQTVVYTKETVTPSEPVASGLKVWFDAKDGSGSQTTWTDKSPNVNNATLTGFSFDGTTDGWMADGSLKGDGVDAYAVTGTTLGITQSRTYQFKIKVNNTNNKSILGVGGTAANSYIDATIYGGHMIAYSGGSTSSTNIPFPVTVGDVIDVALVFDGSNITFYKNGVKLTGSHPSIANGNGTLTMLSGKSTFTYSANQLYYALVYNRALSESEIMENYNAFN